MKDYFYKPPLNKLSLTFLEKSLESAYRISYQEEVCVKSGAHMPTGDNSARICFYFYISVIIFACCES